jgi:hypothetical protein
LEALGIEWIDEDGGRPVKLRPGPIWPQALTRYALPQLPGDWLVLDDEIVALPVGPVAQVVRRYNSGMQVAVHPLSVASMGWEANGLRLGGLWPSFATVEQGEPEMQRLVEVIRQEAMPYLNRYGSLEGYLQLCREQNERSPNPIGDPYVLRRQAMTEIMLQRYDDAAASLQALQRVVIQRGNAARDWLLNMAIEAEALSHKLADDPSIAREELLRVLATQKQKRELP